MFIAISLKDHVILLPSAGILMFPWAERFENEIDRILSYCPTNKVKLASKAEEINNGDEAGSELKSEILKETLFLASLREGGSISNETSNPGSTMKNIDEKQLSKDEFDNPTIPLLVVVNKKIGIFAPRTVLVESNTMKVTKNFTWGNSPPSRVPLLTLHPDMLTIISLVVLTVIFFMTIATGPVQFAW